MLMNRLRFFAVQLGEVFPERISLGIEIRQKVSQFVADRVEALRA